MFNTVKENQHSLDNKPIFWQKDERFDLEGYKQQIEQAYQSSVNLPKLDIPYYDGNQMKWMEFWDFFKVTVDHNGHLSDKEKLLYLKSRLTGEAKRAIAGLCITSENYGVAKTLLKERFGDAQLILNFHYIQLINLPSAQNSSKGLRLLYDQVESHLRILQALQQDISHDIFMFIITSKIPKDVLFQLELQKGARNKWSVSMLRELFKNYICATERAEQQQYCSVKAESESGLQLQTYTCNNGLGQRPKQKNHHRFFLLCKYCNGNHWSDQCLVYPTAQDRKQKLKDSCFLCLRQGHIAYECMSNKTCLYCERRHHHHRSLCPKKFPENDKETQSVEENCHTIKTKQRSGTEVSRNLDEEVKQDKRKETAVQSEGLQQPINDLNSEVCNKKVKNTELEEDASCEQERTCKGDNNERDRKDGQLESKYVELSNKVLHMTEELLKLKMENKNFETQLRDISMSVASKYQNSKTEMHSWNTKSTRNVKAVQGESRQIEKDKDENTKLKRITEPTKHTSKKAKRLKPFFEFRANVFGKDKLSEYLERRFYEQTKTNWQARNIPRLWECRGDPTSLISF